MTHEEIHGRLSDFVDGALVPDQAAAVEAHLRECGECRSTVAGLRQLLDDVAALPRSIEPPRDLWGPVAPRLGGPRLRERTLWSLRYALAAAATLLVMATAAITAVITRGSLEGPGATTAGASRGLAYLVAWDHTEAEYRRAAAELEEALEVARSRLAPATVALIEKNLLVIEAAIQESRAALAADPGNLEVIQMLSAVYQKQLDVLRHVTRLSSST